MHGSYLYQSKGVNISGFVSVQRDMFSRESSQERQQVMVMPFCRTTRKEEGGLSQPGKYSGAT